MPARSPACSNRRRASSSSSMAASMSPFRVCVTPMLRSASASSCSSGGSCDSISASRLVEGGERLAVVALEALGFAPNEQSLDHPTRVRGRAEGTQRILDEPQRLVEVFELHAGPRSPDE